MGQQSKTETDLSLYALIKLDNGLSSKRRAYFNSHQNAYILLCFTLYSHALLYAEMAAYGFSNNSLGLLYSYLSNREQRVEINCTFSGWKSTLSGISHGSVLWPLLLNTLIKDCVLDTQSSQVCNFANDNTLFAYGKNIEEVMACLAIEIENAISWFRKTTW